MSDAAAKAAIKSKIDANPVMLFMKGTPQFPQCGFSAAVIQILDYLGVDYGTENVLADPEIRQGVKDYSDWPTIPQLYVKGEFVGGCDIVKEMFETGELKQFLADKGVAIAA
jgi:monothiol glutaredoxin